MNPALFFRLRGPAFALSFGALLLVTACNRDKDSAAAPLDELVTTAEDHSFAENDEAVVADFIEQDTPADLDRAITPTSDAAARHSLAGGCATRTWDPVTRTLVIDFGAVNCSGTDGRTRRGQLTAVFTGRPQQPGTQVTITRQNYFVNDNQLLGTKLLTYNTFNAWRVQVTGGEIRFADGRTATWTSDRTVERTAAPGTPTTLTIRGSASGVNRKGNAYSATIDAANPLVKRREAGCYRVFVAGIVTIVNYTRDRTAQLNYNPGGATPAPCDLLATVAVNGGAPRQITLR